MSAAAPLPRVDFDAVKDAARANKALAEYLAPGGRVQRGLYWPKSPLRADRHAGSFVIDLAKAVWFDHATDEGGDLIDLWRRVHGLPDRVAAARATAEWLRVPPLERRPQAQASAPAVAKPRADDDDEAERIARARRIWRQAVDPRGTLAEIYLHRRGLELPDELAGRVVRFHPKLWLDAERPSVPGLVAAYRSFKPNEDIDPDTPPIAVGCLYLKEDGDAIRRPDGKRWRKSHGPVGRCAIKISPGEDVEQGFHVAEGFETALALYRQGWRPIWALGSRGTIERFTPLPGIETLTVWADHAKPGLKAAHLCADAWAEAGAEVLIKSTKQAGLDFADLTGATHE